VIHPWYSKYDFSRRMVENERSSVFDVRERVGNSCRRMDMCGNRRASHFSIVSAAVTGRSDIATAAHFSFQRSDSAAMMLTRSDLYKSRASLRSSKLLVSTDLGSRP